MRRIVVSGDASLLLLFGSATLARFLRTFSLLGAALGGIATFLVYLPQIVSDIETLEGPLRLSQPSPSQSQIKPSPPSNPQPKASVVLDDRYVLPAAVTTTEFEQCLSTLALVDGRDFTIREVSSVYRVVIPTVSDSAMAWAYEECVERLRRQ
jgi:hypothetical protein